MEVRKDYCYEIKDVLSAPLHSERLSLSVLEYPTKGYRSETASIPLRGIVIGRDTRADTVEVVHNDTVLAKIPIDMERKDVLTHHPSMLGFERSGFLSSLSVLGMPAEFELALRTTLQDGSRIPIGSVRVTHKALHHDYQPALRPLMLTSLGRTGTTWVMKLLSEHPAIVIVRDYPYEARVAQYWTLMLHMAIEPLQFVQYADRDFIRSHFFRFADVHKITPNLNDSLHGLFERINEGISVKQCLKAIDSFYMQVGNMHGKKERKFFMEKHLNANSPREFWELYPDARELILVRDPRDMVCSMQAFNKKKDIIAFGRQFVSSDQEHITLLRESLTDLLTAWRQRSDKAYLLRYEDLICNPKTTVVALLRYLEVESSPFMIDSMLGKASEDSVELREHRTTSDPKASIGRWHTELPNEIRGLCNDMFKDILNAFGYEDVGTAHPASIKGRYNSYENRSLPEPMQHEHNEGIIKIGFLQSTNEIDVQWFKPLAFGYLKAYLDKNLNVPVQMDLLDSALGLHKYHVAAISSTSQDYAQAIHIARSVKQLNKNIITVLGGHHITYLPETLTEDLDIGVRGEGEQTFLELIHYFQANGLVIKPEKLRDIRGIVFRGNGKIIVTEKRPHINLDDLPHPHRQTGDSQYIFTSRGCPFKCSFCSSTAFWEETRFFSAEYVVEEMEQLLDQFPDMKQIPIWDDLFIADKRRLLRIIELVEAKGINKKVNFSFSVRANLVDDDMCKALKRLNVIGVAFGAESGSDRVLKLMNKGTTVSQNQKALDLLHAYGIPVMCSFIVGWPTETEEEVRKTFDFILQNVAIGKLSTSNAINILMPIPGTAVWDKAVSDGLIVLDHLEWKRLSTFASYKDSKLNSFDEWVEHRRNSNSLYLNENTLPQDRLYLLMAEYYHAIDILEKQEPDQRDHLVFRGPETVNLELTLRCNLKCRMCQRSSQGFTLPPITDMPMSMVEKVLPLLKDTKCIWLSGFGEPLMHEDLVSIIRKIRAVNQTGEIAFTTNFVLMTGRKLNEIIESGLSLVQVSMDGDNEMGHAFSPTPEGVSRYQDVLWRNLMTFHATKQKKGFLNPKLQFCFVGMKRNIDQLERIIKRGLEVGLSSIVVQPVRDYHGSLKGEDLFEHRDYALPLLARAREFADRHGVEFICRFMDEKMSVTRNQCNFPKTFFHVAVDGNVFMCCEGIASGQNIGSTNPRAIWNSTQYQQLRRELATGKLRKKCWNCPLVSPTANSKAALRKGFLEMTPTTLTDEIVGYRNYIDGCHEREQALESAHSRQRDDLLRRVQPFELYTGIVKRIAAAEIALSKLTHPPDSLRGEDTLLQDCSSLFKVLFALLNDLAGAQRMFPTINTVTEEMVASATNMAQIIQSFESCDDLAAVNHIISDHLLSTLGVWTGFFAQCRADLNRSLEENARLL